MSQVSFRKDTHTHTKPHRERMREIEKGIKEVFSDTSKPAAHQEHHGEGKYGRRYINSNVYEYARHRERS